MAADSLGLPIALIGVGLDAQRFWQARCKCAAAHWVGHVADDDLPALYRGAQCLLQPSLAEGFGYPPLEAMACGVPVVVSGIDVLKETTGGNALLCDPQASDPWQHAIHSLADPDRRERLVAAGLDWSRRFQGGHGWRKHVDDIENLFSLGERS